MHGAIAERVGERRIKTTLYIPLIPTFSLKGEGAGTCVDTYAQEPNGQRWLGALKEWTEDERGLMSTGSALKGIAHKPWCSLVAMETTTIVTQVLSPE